VKHHKYVIGVALNLLDARALLLRDDHKVIFQIDRKRKSIKANETISILLSLLEEVIHKSRQYKQDLLGIGLALGGVVDKKKGIVYWPEKYNAPAFYIAVPFKKYLEEKFNLPIYMENDASAAAWAEYLVNFKHYKNLIYMFSGVGCGLVLNGELYTGKDGGAGELFLNRQRVMSSPMGEFSFLSQWPHDLGVVRRAKQLISFGKHTALIKKIDSVGRLSLDDVFWGVKSKDRLAKEILKEAAFCLGVKLSLLINLFNPEVIVIGGGLEESGDFFLEEVHKVTKEFSFSALHKNLKIHLSSLGKQAPLLGASFIVLK
jgi:glucokinase